MRYATLICLIFFIACNNRKDLNLLNINKNEVVNLNESLNLDAFLKNSVIVAYDAECPVCILYKTSLDYLSKTYTQYSFKIIFTKDADINEAMNRFYDDSQFEFYQDLNHAFFKKIGATTTPHVFVFDSNSSEIYSGKIDDKVRNLGSKKEFADSLYLSDALRALESNNIPKIKKTTPVGCLIQ
jgi:hypothetical protein